MLKLTSPTTAATGGVRFAMLIPIEILAEPKEPIAGGCIKIMHFRVDMKILVVDGNQQIQQHPH